MDEIWTARSSPGKQAAAAVGISLVGALLAFGFRDFQDDTNALAGFLLGLLLLGVGIPGLLLVGPQSVTIDPRRRCITVEDTNRFGAKTRMILFSEIGRVAIGYQGRRSSGVQWHYLALQLKDGSEYPLFAPGRFYDGASDRAVVAGWRQRLEEYLRR